MGPLLGDGPRILGLTSKGSFNAMGGYGPVCAPKASFEARFQIARPNTDNPKGASATALRMKDDCRLLAINRS